MMTTAELKSNLSALQLKLKNAKSKKAPERTDADNLEIAELECAIADAKAQIRKAERDELKSKIQKAKEAAFLKILAANHVETEQELKDLFAYRDIAYEAGIGSPDDLHEYFSPTHDHDDLIGFPSDSPDETQDTPDDAPADEQQPQETANESDTPTWQN